MPLYEYRCADCRTRFELQRSIKQRDDPVECPACNGAKCGRLLSLPLSFTLSEDGAVRAIGGSPCSGCTTTACSGCSVRH